MKEITESPLHIGDVERFRPGLTTVRIAVPALKKWFIGIFKSVSSDNDNLIVRLDQKIKFIPARELLAEPTDPGELLFVPGSVVVSLSQDDQPFVFSSAQRARWPGLDESVLVIKYKTMRKQEGWAVFTERTDDKRILDKLIKYTSSNDDQSQAAA